MKNAIMLCATILLCSCGIDHKVKGLKEIKAEADVGPNFEKAAKFCDERYGYKTPESEDCFDDYRGFYDMEMSINLNSIKSFCEDTYTQQEDVDACITDLVRIITNKSDVEE